MYEDKKLVCMECGQEFVFTSGEQEFYAMKGLANEPKRCKACIQARKKRIREGYITVCANCGGEARVPFQPKEGKPLYCEECYRKMKPE